MSSAFGLGIPAIPPLPSWIKRCKSEKQLPQCATKTIEDLVEGSASLTPAERVNVDAAIVECLIRTGRLFNTKRGREKTSVRTLNRGQEFLLFPRLTMQLGCIAASARKLMLPLATLPE